MFWETFQVKLICVFQVPGKSLKTFHPESVFSHFGDRKGEGGGV